MENTRTNACKLCGLTVQELWIEPEVMTLDFLGSKRKFTVANGFWKTILINGFCPNCKKVEDEKNEKEKIEKAIQEKIKKGVETLGGEYAYRNFRFDSYKPKTESQKEAFKIADGFNPLSDNLFFVGPTGTGKTHLACSIANKFIEKVSLVKRFKVTELLREFRALNDARLEKSMFEDLSDADILILEDMGAQKETDWGNSILWEILDNRIERGRNGLVITSNLGRSLLAQSIGERIPSRISQICKVVKVDGPDYRVNSHGKD